MSKQQTNKPASPAELISKAEADIARLEHEREAHVARGAELAERRKAASYGAHVQHDPESRKQLDAVNAEIGMHASELQSFDDALATARTKLAEAQQAQAREQRKAALKEQQKLSAEFRKIGPFMDRATDDLRRGMLALKQNAASVGKDHRHVATLHRCLQVAFFGTPLQEYVGVPDSNDRRNFSSFSGVINAWCDGHAEALKHELEALDGAQQEHTEAA
jgi:hypothetical protein